MSIIMPDTLRYIKRSQLEEEQKIMANYYQDIIRSYGIDVLYIKRDNDFATSGVNSDIIYGHQTNASYILSTNMITYMEVDSSILALNGLGLVPQDELTFYFSINDFGASFANDISQYTEFPITTVSGYTSYTINNLSGKFTSDIIDGTYSYNMSGALSGNNIPLDVTDLSTPIYSIYTNPYLNTSFSSNISGGYVSPNLFLSFNKGIYKGINRTFYSVSGYVLYSDLDLALKHSTKIHPNVGDIVRIDFPGGEQLEEYEINEVLSRRPTSNEGVNPLLGKYVWRCKATRRIASYEEIVDNDMQNENATEDLMDIIKKTQHDKNSTFKEINDYSITDVDDVYGGYESASGLVNDPDRYVDTEPLSSSTYYTIHDFNNSSSLLTDGLDLFFKTSISCTNITNNVSGNTYDSNASLNVPIIMYLKIKNGNIYFTSYINTENKLTNFTLTDKKGQYSFDYVLNNVNNKYNLNDSSSYVFKSDRYALISNGILLSAINETGDEDVIN